MAFEFKKFLTENRLTTISKLTLLKEEEEDEIQDEPTSKDIKPSKSTDDLAKKQYQLASLLKRKDELVSKFKSNEITIDQYKQMIGNIPQHIKTLSADIERLESQTTGNIDESKSKDLDEASYEVLERIEGLVNQKDLQRFKESIQYISDDLEDEGFDGSEIKAFLQREFDEMLGMWK
jgi:predicted  nucleic acid-binding Zn-ribbon protein